MTADLRPGTLEVIRATPAVLRAMLAGIPGAVTETPGPEGWSPADVVAHLVVAGRLGALARASRALEEDHPLFSSYEEEAELDASGLRGRPVGELIALLDRERAAMPVLGREVSRDETHRSGVHREVGEVTVAELLHQAAYHDALHLAQIASLLSSSFEDGRGALSSASS